MIVQQKSKFY